MSESATAKAVSAAGTAPKHGPKHEGRDALLFAAAAVLAGAGVCVYLVAILGSALDAPTIALSLAAVALMYVLRQMFAVVQALSRAPEEHRLDEEAEYEGRVAELRSERFRLLKAIKELDQDHELGKLDAADHGALRRELALRAVDIKRRLDAGAGRLHPALQRDLESRSTVEPKAPAAAAAAAACLSCDGSNDPDAKFCKHCGADLRAPTNAGADLDRPNSTEGAAS